MPNHHGLTEHQKRLRFYAWIFAALTAVMAVCWHLGIPYAQVLCGAFLLATCLLSARIGDISRSRAKDQQSEATTKKNAGV